MLKTIFIWTAGTYLFVSLFIGGRDQFRKHGHTFNVVGVHVVKTTLAGDMYHIVATREPDNEIFIFDRISDPQLKASEKFDVVFGVIVPKSPTAKAPRQ